MSALACLLLCIQTCLIQNAFAVCSGPAAAYSLGAGISAPCALSAGIPAQYNIPALPSPSPYGAFLHGASLTPAGYMSLPNYGLGTGCGAAYGGSGIGNVAVAGELPVGGSTALAGQVPIIGAVEYSGPVAAAGAVTIAGNCACNSAPAYSYNYGVC